MKMTTWCYCVLVHDFSGEPVVRPDEPGVFWTDVSDSVLEVSATTSEEEVEKKKQKKKKRKKKKKKKMKGAVKDPLTAVLELLLLSVLPCRFLIRSVAIFLSLCRLCRNHSRKFRKQWCLDCRGDWGTVEVASHCCYQEHGAVSWGPNMMSVRLSTV